MLTLFSKKIKSNLFKTFKELYNMQLNLPFIECPYCNSTDIIKWGFYERNIYYTDSVIKYETLKVQRVRCKACGKTHALLPSFIVPYKQHLLDIILLSLLDNKITNEISFDTICKWKKQFRKFSPYLKTMMKKQDNKEIIIQFLKDINFNYEKYYQSFRCLLLMMHKSIYNIAYF